MTITSLNTRVQQLVTTDPRQPTAAGAASTSWTPAVRDVLDAPSTVSGSPFNAGALPLSAASHAAETGVGTTPEYTRWLDGLGTLANETNPSTSTMLDLAEALGVPRQTAVQDIFDAFGLSAHASTNHFLSYQMASVLQAGDAPSNAEVARLIETMRWIDDRGALQRQAMRDSRAINEIQRYRNELMQVRSPAGVAAVQAEHERRVQYASALDGLEDQTRAYAHSYAEVADDEAARIVDTVAGIQDAGEPPNFVSVAECNAIVAGTAGLPPDERTAALGQIAQEMLDRQAAGTLSIDASVQGAVEQAAADGAALAAAATSA